MKKGILWILLAGLLLISPVLASCSGGAQASAGTTSNDAPEVSPTQAEVATPPANTALTIISGSTVKYYTMLTINGFAQTVNYGGQKNTTGLVVGKALYAGVALVDLLKGIGGIQPGQKVKFTSYDGSSSTMTYDQITNGKYTNYDANGNVVTPEDSAQTMPVITLVYSANDNNLANGAGPLEIGVLYGLQLYTDDSLWIKSVVKIEVTN
jgi:hypothetical protein